MIELTGGHSHRTVVSLAEDFPATPPKRALQQVRLRAVRDAGTNLEKTAVLAPKSVLRVERPHLLAPGTRIRPFGFTDQF
ncbi:hypothetical protein EAH83_16260 [Variovorax ginsengisoli]|uniref:Uncharacterized protein n=1 Tax=Variovorax guangxiensis TaxID=1775474 RepID=A0A502DPI4_9BURK|nr:hypothetical protein EAH83_16260 [Variovorax ginsengisoli]TPG26036.1 hypothetical protein EAH82_16745 [Variovorax guangxiensis]